MKIFKKKELNKNIMNNKEIEKVERKDTKLLKKVETFSSSPNSTINIIYAIIIIIFFKVFINETKYPVNHSKLINNSNFSGKYIKMFILKK